MYGFINERKKNQDFTKSPEVPCFDLFKYQKLTGNKRIIILVGGGKVNRKYDLILY